MLLDQENHKLIEKNLALAGRVCPCNGEPQLDLAMKLGRAGAAARAAQSEAFRRFEARSDRARQGLTKRRSPSAATVPREQPELPIVEEIHKLDVPDQTCPQCGGQLQEWAGQFEESFETDVLERRFFRRKHKRQKYRCACQSCVETAPGPAKLTKGGQYSVELAVQVAVSKYLDHVPLERQVRIMQRQGLIVDSQTLWDQIEALASHLALIHEALHAPRPWPSP